MNEFDITDKVIILTGGSGFLGSRLNDHLQSAGAKVVSFDLMADPAVDITNASAIQTAVDRVISEYGVIDGLIHAAALNAVPGSDDSNGQFSRYEEYPLELWEKSFAINVTAANLVTQAVAPVLIERRHGSVVFIASDLGIIAPNNSIYEAGKYKDIAYATSKSAMIGLARNWASYLGEHNVRSNSISPGGIYNNQPEEFVKKNSALNMLGRMAKPDEYNGAIQFLLSGASSYMTGTNMVVDGGRSAW